LSELAENAISNPVAAPTITGNDAATVKMYFDSIVIKCARDFLQNQFGKRFDKDAKQSESKPTGD
jgi:hypothetical protein